MGYLEKPLIDALNKIALVSETDLNGNIVYMNDKFLEVSGYSRSDILGKNHRILKSGHQPDEMFKDLWKTISGGEIWQGKIMNKAKNGTFYYVNTVIVPMCEKCSINGYLSIRVPISKEEFNKKD